MFDIAPDYQTPARMSAKMQALSLPDFKGKSVLDCGTDFGFWAFLAAERGAAFVVGLDRNREVRGRGKVDLVEMNTEQAKSLGWHQCRFEETEMGKDWRTFGKFDVLLVMSVYHHIYQCAGGDHAPIWFWLAQQCLPGGVLIWEGPVDVSDPVVRANVSKTNQAGYTQEGILEAAGRYFEAEYIGPALHEPTRHVWRFTRKASEAEWICRANVGAGAGGAAPAFRYAGGRRQKEIEAALGFEPVPGSLNLFADKAFDWDRDYFRARVSDVLVRGQGLDTEWAPRWCRFYPVKVDGHSAWAMKFEGDQYSETFVEVIAPIRLRDHLTANTVTLTRSLGQLTPTAFV